MHLIGSIISSRSVKSVAYLSAQQVNLRPAGALGRPQPNREPRLRPLARRRPGPAPPFRVTFPRRLSELRVTFPSRLSESPFRVTFPSHLSESPFRVTFPSRLSESPLRVSQIRVAFPSRLNPRRLFGLGFAWRRPGSCSAGVAGPAGAGRAVRSCSKRAVRLSIGP